MSFVRRHASAIASTAVVAAAAATVVALTLSSHGYPSRHLDLHDGGIWVTNDAKGLFGRLNKPAEALDLGFGPQGVATAGGLQLDIRQDGAAVVAWDKSDGKLSPVDVDDGKLIDDQSVAAKSNEVVAMNGGTVAVLDRSNYQIRAMRVDDQNGITSLSGLDSHKPLAAFNPVAITQGTSAAADLTVGTNGEIFAATADGQVLTIAPHGAGFAKPKTSRLDSSATLHSVQVTAVGTHMVVFDPTSGAVQLPGGQSAQINQQDPQAQIQQSSAAQNSVIIATSTSLWAVPLGGGNPTKLAGGGTGRPAAPTWLGPCVHAAWAGNPGVYQRSCNLAPAKQYQLPDAHALSQPVFRENRGAILLNDLDTGAIFDVETMQEVDHQWQSVTPPPRQKRTTKHHNNNAAPQDTRDQPPSAKPDILGGRPGRTAVLHVLDNDSDPDGDILSIRHVTTPDVSGATLSIAPDGQTIEAALPSGVSDVHFDYTIDDGRQKTSTTHVTVHPYPSSINQAPNLRPRFQQRSFVVAAGAELKLPVLSDWRDHEGDPIVLQSATAGAGTVTTTTDGSIDYFAPATGGKQKIVYTVTDGAGASVEHTVPLTVLAPTSEEFVKPVAEPDTARGEVGRPITITPLDNDLPGTDPTDPTASLALLSSVNSPAGTTVETDLTTGTITVTATRPGTFLLNYLASFGNAGTSKGTIRVDVIEAPSSPASPVAMPDTAVAYGQNSVTVDVLANDFDPAGGVLVVQQAKADSAGANLQVAVQRGRWLRVTATSQVNPPLTQVIDYTVTNGVSPPVTGELTVTWLTPPTGDTPIAVPDYATVRAGDSVLIPVLDNDIDPTGAPLTLKSDGTEPGHSGRITLAAVSGTAQTGQAYVSGNAVRFVSPAGLTVQRQMRATYVVSNPSGDSAQGVVTITVVPPPSRTNPNRPPQPKAQTARLVAGETVVINLPTTGIDPDGDTATVTGIASATRLGRVLSINSTSITYQAFPTSAGTDTLRYIVTDRYGASATAAIKIGVVPPGQAQPPVAVDDTATAAPHTKIQVDVLANDLVSADDKVTIQPLNSTNSDLSGNARLLSPTGPIEFTTPDDVQKPIQIVYGISDGLASSVGTLTVHVRSGYVAPPTAVDAYAKPKPNAATVGVDVLSRDSDPGGSQVHIVKLFGIDQRNYRIAGKSVTVPVRNYIQNIPYEIANEHGATAAAVIHVPASGTGAPYSTGTQVTIAKNGSKTINLSDYVIDPANKKVRLTLKSEMFTAPVTGLTLSSPSTTSLKLTGQHDFVGPAAITFQVTDGTSLDDPKGRLAYITIPVQVGPETPVLRCPDDSIELVEGGKPVSVDVTSICHVWTANPADASALGYTANWTKQPGGVNITGTGSQNLTLNATGTAKPGSTGTLQVGVRGHADSHGTLLVRIAGLGGPSISPLTIDGFKAGATASRDIKGLVTSPLRDPHVTVVRITQNSGQHAATSATGSVVHITPGSTTHGTMTFTVVASDVADKRRADRQTSGTITMHVLNHPDAPGRPVPGRTVQSQVVQLSWSTPQNNGAPIDYYEVAGGGHSQRCTASPCAISGLHNGTGYNFTVRAHNSVGFGPASAASPTAVPDTLPGAVPNIVVSRQGDHTVTLSWPPADNKGSAITHYLVTWQGGNKQSVPGRSVTINGLTNDVVYTFSVTAYNKLGPGPATSQTGQSAGTPPAPAGVTAQESASAGTTTRGVTVSWQPTDPNGPGPTRYTVSRNGAVVCSLVTATTCSDQPSTGTTYTYSVVAVNGPGKTSPPGTATLAVNGTPSTPSSVSVAHNSADGQLVVNYNLGSFNGAGTYVKCSYNGGSCNQWTAAAGSGSHVVTNLPPNADVTISLTQCNTELCGAPASARSAHTDGPPNPPSGGSCGLSGDDVTWRWSAAAPINGYAVHYQFSVDGSTATTTGTSHTKTEPEDGQNRTLTVHSIDSRGEPSGSISVSCGDHAKPNPPPRAVSLTKGTSAQGQPNCGSPDCHYVRITVANFAPNTTYNGTFQAESHPWSGGPRSFTVRTDGNGNGTSAQGGSYFGYPNTKFDIVVGGDTYHDTWT